jgi:hypothetical protein
MHRCLENGYIVPVEGLAGVFQSAPSLQVQFIRLTNFKEFVPFNDSY